MSQSASFPAHVESPFTDAAHDLTYLRVYLLANLCTCTTFGIGLVAMRFTLVRSNWMLFDAAVVLATSAALLAALRLLRNERIAAVLTTLAVGNWVCSVVTVIVTPFILAPVVLSVLLPMVAAIPYLERRRMIVTSAGAIIATALAAIAAHVRIVDGVEQRAPGWLRTGIVLVSVPLVAALIVINVWRAHLSLLARAQQLQRSRARIVESTDAARRTFERDLHDGAQQRLAAIAIRLGLARRLVEHRPAQAVEVIDGLDRELIEAIAELRDLAHGIYPPLLEQRGLGEALRAAARRVPVPVSVDPGGLGRYPTEIETAVYFSCLEAMHNAVKHGRPSAIGVRLVASDRTEPQLRFEVTDDGAGFDTAQASPGTGLVNVSDRLGSVGGELRLRSAPGQGTTVSGSIPLPEQAEREVVLAPLPTTSPHT
jgi:signal transduction histidine kinase